MYGVGIEKKTFFYILIFKEVNPWSVYILKNRIEFQTQIIVTHTRYIKNVHYHSRSIAQLCGKDSEYNNDNNSNIKKETV